jgi:hypothetical protein
MPQVCPLALKPRKLSTALTQRHGVNLARRTLAVIQNDKNIETYGVAFNHTLGDEKRNGKQPIWYPTACQVPGRGLRLYISWDLVDEDGHTLDQRRDRDELDGSDLQRIYANDRKQLNLGAQSLAAQCG